MGRKSTRRDVAPELKAKARETRHEWVRLVAQALQRAHCIKPEDTARRVGRILKPGANASTSELKGNLQDCSNDEDHATLSYCQGRSKSAQFRRLKSAHLP